MLAVATAIGVGVLSSCSSDNDVVVPAITNNTLIGSEVEDASSEVSLSNLKTAGTRAAAGYNLDALGIPTTMPDAPSIPSDAQDLTTDAPWNPHKGNYKVDAGTTVDLDKYSVDMTDCNLYIAGNVTLNQHWGNCTIHVLKGGTLTLNNSGDRMLNSGGTIYNYGTINAGSNKTGFYVANDCKLYNAGTLNTRELPFKVQGTFYTTGDMPKASEYTFEKGSLTNVLGSFNCGSKSSIEGNMHFGGCIFFGRRYPWYRGRCSDGPCMSGILSPTFMLINCC